MTVEHASQELDQSLRQRGALIMALFALVWAMAGRSGIASGPARVTVLVAALTVTAGVVLLAFRAGPAAGRMRRLPASWEQRFNIVSLAQGVAIGLVIVALVVTERPALIPAAVCLIVGIHFFPLVRIFDQPQYRWTGAALCAVAAAGFVTYAAADGETSRAVAGLGAAITLWATSMHVALRG